MGGQETQRTDSKSKGLIKLTNFYFSPHRLYTHRSRISSAGGKAGSLCFWGLHLSQEQDVGLAKSSARRTEQNGLLGTCPQDLSHSTFPQSPGVLIWHSTFPQRPRLCASKHIWLTRLLPTLASLALTAKCVSLEILL